MFVIKKNIFLFFFDFILLNLFFFLNFLNSTVSNRDSYDSKLHSYIFLSGTIALNVFTITRLAFHFLYGNSISYYLFYLMTSVIFIIFYFIYFKYKRFEKILNNYKISIQTKIFSILFTVIYLAVTFYFMIIVGDYLVKF